MSDLSVYVHIPWCQAKCPYCDFNSWAASAWPEERYVAALCRELREYAADPRVASSTVRTIFFGGGTPSLFAPSSIRRVLEEIGAVWTVVGEAEVTLEANPGTVGEENLGGFRAAGVNRLSFGVQSFQPHHLQRLGRIHDAEQARRGARMARAAGFDNLNLDLIYALPEQTLAEWESDLDEVLALGPDHVSAYNLTYEEGTAFHEWKRRGQLGPLPEDVEIAMFEITAQRLGEAGLARYEISNHARPGRQCAHNRNYWQSGAWVGVGAGAHGGLPGPARGTWRWGNERSPQRYIEMVERRGHARASEEHGSEAQTRGEFVFLGLRLLEGFSEAEFRRRFGTRFVEAFPHAQAFIDEGLLESDEERCRLTPRGLLVGDTLFATFL